jgi:lipoprotein-releasing system permease protein
LHPAELRRNFWVNLFFRGPKVAKETMTVEFFIGNRYLRTKQKKAFISLITFLSVAGVTVGVMALIVVIAVMAGAREDLQERILNINAHITLQSRYTSFSGYQEVLKTVEGVPGVESATPFITIQVMVRSAGGYSPAIIRGVDLASAGRVIKYLDTDPLIGQGERRKVDSSFKPGLVAGKELAAHLGLHVGDTVQLISPRGGIASIGHLPGMEQYQVVGLFESGMYEYDRSLGFMSLADAQNNQHSADGVNGIEIRVSDISRAGIIRQQIEDALGFPFWSMDWMQKYQNLFSSLELQKTVMFIILSLIVLVAALNIAGTLVMMVMEKKKALWTSPIPGDGSTRSIPRSGVDFSGHFFLGSIPVPSPRSSLVYGS